MTEELVVWRQSLDLRLPHLQCFGWLLRIRLHYFGFELCWIHWLCEKVSVLFLSFCVKLAQGLVKFFGRHCFNVDVKMAGGAPRIKNVHPLLFRAGSIFVCCNRLEELFNIFVWNYRKFWNVCCFVLLRFCCWCCFGFGLGGLETVRNCSNIWRKVGDHLIKTDSKSWKIICK